MKENDPSSVLLFLVGTKKDLSVGGMSPKITHIVAVDQHSTEADK